MHDVTHWLVGLFLCYIECVSIFFLVYSCLALQLIDWKSTVNFVANILSWTKKQPLPWRLFCQPLGETFLRHNEGTVLFSGKLKTSFCHHFFIYLMKHNETLLNVECFFWNAGPVSNFVPKALSLTLKERGDTRANLDFFLLQNTVSQLMRILSFIPTKTCVQKWAALSEQIKIL